MTQVPLYAWPKSCFAGFWKRLAAFLMDSLLIRAASKIIFNLTVHHLISPDLAGDVWWYRLAKLGLFLAYFTVSSYYLDGQTFGKVVMGLKVINLKTSELTCRTLLLREIAGRTILYFFPIVAVSLVFTPQRQHVLDWLADTAVIDLRQLRYTQKLQGLTLVVPEGLTSKIS